jgi:hypothetical protein
MSAATDDPTGIDIPKDSTYLADRQVKEWQGELDQLQRTLADPKARLEDRGEVTRQLRKIEHDLHFLAPPDTTPAQRDAISLEEKELRAKIVAAMPSQEEMRKCPPGAIGKQQEFHRKFEATGIVTRWKNLRRILNKGNEDPDVSNLELYRTTQSTLNMDNALIPGKAHFPSPDTPAYRENYDQIDWGEGSPAQKKIEELQAQITEMQQQLASNGAKSGKKRKLEMMPAACGRMFSGAVGVKAHERSHKCAEHPAQGGEA